MFRKLLCLLGIHEYEKQTDPFGFGDEIETCKYCTSMKCEVTIIEIK